MQVGRSAVSEKVATFPPAGKFAISSARMGRLVQDDSYGEERRGAYLLAKRSLDVLVASSLLLLLFPFLVVIALAIWLDSPGPVFFRQPRIGRQARTFTMLKFRTMRPEPPFDDLPIAHTARSVPVKSRVNPRITRLGRFLRQTSVDELPQLLNVLRGEMSLVGPRPELVEMLEFYGPEHYRRHQAVPGLTGWWQINGRCCRRDGARPEEDLAQKLADDEEYNRRRSLWFDMKILLRTIPVVLGQRGAY
jgi:lipopolysaccharide/colanic/teichoic acid biosynthesis glycosyltransferase